MGASPEVWLRHLLPGCGYEASSWPRGGGFDAAFIRLPKSKDALAMALHAAAGTVAPGSPIVVLGANAEGIRSVRALLGVVAEDIETVSLRHHSRVIAGRRRGHIDALKAQLIDWRRTGTIQLCGTERSWVSYSGTFAKGGLDDGTAFLLNHLAMAHGPGQMLDFAAGTGVLAAALATQWPDAEIDMIEADAVALVAAAENVPVARPILGHDLGAIGTKHYDLIVSNPPIHDGIRESRVVLEELIALAPSHLKPGGALRLVVQHRVAVLPLLRAAFPEASIIADNGRFTVAEGRRGSRQR